MMQGELKVDRFTNGQECRCCGLSIWKLTKTLVLAKIARGARARVQKNRWYSSSYPGAEGA